MATNSQSFKASADAAERSRSKGPLQQRLQGGSKFVQLFSGLIWQTFDGLRKTKIRNQLLALGAVTFLLTVHLKLTPSFEGFFQPAETSYPPLAMSGGDPYLRALMRTISASESNDRQPYGLLYGGQYFSDWSRHPDKCIPIQSGPSQGDCTTAAGRYQFITTTWEEKAQRYQLNPDGWLFWQHYTFDPASQDRVVYRWLDDPSAWDADIPALLRSGQLNEVLYRLSGTWTSLGYGTETNAMTPQLNALYQSFLKEEKSRSPTSKPL